MPLKQSFRMLAVGIDRNMHIPVMPDGYSSPAPPTGPRPQASIAGVNRDRIKALMRQ